METFEQKKARILTKISANGIIFDLKKLKNEVVNGPDVNLNRAKKLIRNVEQDPGLETKISLFYFKNKFHLIESGKYRKTSESEVRKTLDEQPETMIYFICSENSCSMPQVLSGKDQEIVKLKDDQEVIDYIKKVSGVELKISDL